MHSKAIGPLLIALAASLWATDALFRVPTLKSLNPTVIVLAEHILALAVISPWVFIKRRSDLTNLTAGQWIGTAFIGICGSALATVFFTASFRYLNPSVAILLQKVQPILVVLLAVLFLKERPQKNFFGWALVGLAAAIGLSFPDLNFSFLPSNLDLRSQGVIYTLLAAGFWAISTVTGKHLLSNLTPSVVTFWRFAFGMIGLVVLLILGDTAIPFASLTDTGTMQSLAYMALIPGLFAVMAYYGGLEKTSATVTTFVELLFPVSAVVLNAAFLGANLTPMQIFTGGLLLIAVTMISYEQNKA